MSQPPGAFPDLSKPVSTQRVTTRKVCQRVSCMFATRPRKIRFDSRPSLKVVHIFVTTIALVLSGIIKDVQALPNVKLHVESWEGSPALSPDGLKIAVDLVGRKGTFILDTRDNSILTDDAGDRQVWSPDSKFVACSWHKSKSDTDTVGVFDTVTKKWLTRDKQSDFPLGISWSPDCRRIAISSKESQILDLKTLSISTVPVIGIEKWWWNSKWSPDGRWLACYTPGSICIFKVGAQIELAKIIKAEHSLGFPGDISWAGQGNSLVFSSPGRITILSTKDFQETNRIDTIQSEPVSLAISPDGTKLTYLDSGTLNISDFPNIIRNRQIAADPATLCSLEWSRDGKHLLVSSRQEADIYNAKSGQLLGFTPLNDAFATWLPTSDGILTGGVRFLQSTTSLDSTEQKIHVRLLPLPTTESTTQHNFWHAGPPHWSHTPNPKTLSECFQLLDANLSTSCKARIKKRKSTDLHDFGGGGIIHDGCVASLWTTWGTGHIEQECMKQGIYDNRDVLGFVLKKYWQHLNESKER